MPIERKDNNPRREFFDAHIRDLITTRPCSIQMLNNAILSTEILSSVRKDGRYVNAAQFHKVCDATIDKSRGRRAYRLQNLIWLTPKVVSIFIRRFNLGHRDFVTANYKKSSKLSTRSIYRLAFILGLNVHQGRSIRPGVPTTRDGEGGVQI
jgi:hypothetical protein